MKYIIICLIFIFITCVSNNYEWTIIEKWKHKNILNGRPSHWVRLKKDNGKIRNLKIDYQSYINYNVGQKVKFNMRLKTDTELLRKLMKEAIDERTQLMKVRDSYRATVTPSSDKELRLIAYDKELKQLDSILNDVCRVLRGRQRT